MTTSQFPINITPIKGDMDTFGTREFRSNSVQNDFDVLLRPSQVIFDKVKSKSRSSSPIITPLSDQDAETQNNNFLRIKPTKNMRGLDRKGFLHLTYLKCEKPKIQIIIDNKKLTEGET